MLARGILGSGRTRGVSLPPFLDSSCWWWLMSSAFLIRTSCHKAAHASGHCGAWPGGRFQSVCSPNTQGSGDVWLGQVSLKRCLAGRAAPVSVLPDTHGSGDVWLGQVSLKTGSLLLTLGSQPVLGSLMMLLLPSALDVF